MTDFCHITPTRYLDMFATGRSFHLTLAHLVEQDPTYAEFYKGLKMNRFTWRGCTNIMDNSAFEMYKEGKPMYSTDKLIPMAQACGADYVVMSDYPGEESKKTVKAAIDMAPQLREAGLGTFFCPQSKVGDIEDLLNCFDWAADAEQVDYIGVSILAIPNAYGVEKDNKLQRFLSRWKFMQELLNSGILEKARGNDKKFHFLGMVDGPNEILLVKEFLAYIDTWDSSAAVWAGLQSKKFDNSPSGLIDGKIESHVDFNHNSGTIDQIGMAMYNCQYIDNLLTEDDND